ncbi:VOC family protein [Micromonospora parva]|uniref:VOC family protein n=1 Tax=Micromonospora parva TaxID=1464048 RepID=UPI0033F873E2
MTFGFQFDHVGITTSAAHLDQTIAWYRDHLDFSMIQQFEVGESVFTFIGTDDTKIEIISAGAAANPAPAAESLPASHDVERLHHICLRVPDLDAAIAELDRRGVALFAGPMTVEKSGQRFAFIRDNIGTIIEITDAVPVAG